MSQGRRRHGSHCSLDHFRWAKRTIHSRQRSSFTRQHRRQSAAAPRGRPPQTWDARNRRRQAQNLYNVFLQRPLYNFASLKEQFHRLTTTVHGDPRGTKALHIYQRTTATASDDTVTLAWRTCRPKRVLAVFARSPVSKQQHDKLPVLLEFRKRAKWRSESEPKGSDR